MPRIGLLSGLLAATFCMALANGGPGVAQAEPTAGMVPAAPVTDGPTASAPATPRRRRKARRAPDAVAPRSFGPGNVYANIPPIDDRGRDQLTMFNAWNPDPIGNHERNLGRVNPLLAAIVRKALADNPGLRFVVGSGLRTLAEQQQAEGWGWSPRRRSRKPGRVWVSASLRKHVEGNAVDLWPLDADNRVTFAPSLQAQIGAAMMKASRDLGAALNWGGTWRRRKDPTHFELGG